MALIAVWGLLKQAIKWTVIWELYAQLQDNKLKHMINFINNNRLELEGKFQFVIT